MSQKISLRLSRLALALLLLPSLLSLPAGAETPSGDPPDLTLILTSGLSGRLVDGERTVAEVAGTVRRLADQARAEGRRVVVLDAGHTFLPYAESRFDGGAGMARALEAAGHQALLPSQMDFSLGRDALDRLGRELEIPLVAPLGTEVPGSLVLGTRLDADGLVLEVVSTVDPPAARHLAAVGFETLAAAEALEGAASREEDPADLRLAVVHGHGTGPSLTDREELWRLLEEPRGFDLLVVPDLGHDLVIERLSSEQPVILVGRLLDREDPWKVARLDVQLKRSAGRLHPAGARLTLHTTDPEASIDGALAEKIRETVEGFRLAGSARLPEDRPRSREALVDFALEAVRDFAEAEVAVLNREVFRPVAARFFEAEPVTVEAVRRLLSIDQHLEVGRLKGAQLEALLQESLARAKKDGGPLDDALLFAGLTYDLDGDGKAVNLEINGRPLYAGDPYRVVTTSFLSAGGDGYGPLAAMEGTVLRAGGQGPVEARDDVILPRLLDPSGRPFAQLASKGLWRFGLDRLQLGVTGVRQDGDEAYDDSGDSRASATDSLNLLFTGDLRADQEWRRFRWENRLHLRFGLLDEEDDEETELDDDLRLEVSGLWDPVGDWLHGASPYVGLVYESELRTEDDVPRRDIRSLTAGLDWSFTRWPRVRVGLVARQRDDVEKADRFGLFGELRVAIPSVGRLPALNGRLFAERVEDSAAAVSRLDFELETAVPLGGRLELRPAYNFYVYKDSRLPGNARYQRFSLGLAYRWSGKLQRR